MVDIKDKCTGCIHNGVCKHSNDYNEFYSIVSDHANRLEGDIIAEDVAEVNITCKHFKTNRQSNILREIPDITIKPLQNERRERC